MKAVQWHNGYGAMRTFVKNIQVVLGYFFFGLLLVVGLCASAYAQGSVQTLDELLVEGDEEAEIQSVCPGGIIQIMELGWDSAKILSHMHQIIIEQGFGCTTQIVPSDMSRAMGQLAGGRDPIIVPELWLSRVAPIWNELADQELVQATGATYSSALLQGWYVPDFALSGARVSSVSSFKNLVVEGGVGAGGKVKFISCPPGWACHLINKNMFEAFELNGQFELVEPQTLADMNATIALSLSKQEPVLFYYWEPSALMAQFNFIRLSAGAFNLEGYVCNSSVECATPSQTDFGTERVVMAASHDLVRNHERLGIYLRKANLDIAHMNKALSLQILTQKDTRALAISLLEDQSDWQTWLDEEAVGKVTDYLAAQP